MMMNREILFRGKRVDNGEWIYGWVTSQFKKSTNGELLTKIQSKTFGEGEHLVITETVGQFTGLTDRKDQPIFEGDILNMHGGCDIMDISEYDVRVIVRYGFTGYGSEIGFSGFYKSGMHCPLMLPGALTVIGNIYDNYELAE